jgi:hypothetical protein
MTRRSHWILGAFLGLVALAGAGFLLLLWLLPNDEELAAQIQAQAQAKLGVPVKLGSVSWQLFPPALVIEQATTVQPRPISFERLIAQPRLAELIHRRLRFDHVLVEGGVMPQLSLRGLRVQPAPPGAGATEPVIERLSFRNLTWVTRHGLPLVFDGDAIFAAGWRPVEAQVERPGVKPEASLSLVREGQADRWKVAIRVGGGTADGELVLQEGKGGVMELDGRLAPRNIEVDSAMAAFKRNSAVQGRAAGQTTLTASGANLGELVRSLHTRTDFTMAPATLVRLDVDKAIRTAGRDRSGHTPLRSLTGRMDTQNSPDGMAVRYIGLQAQGETFSASGGGTIANRRIDGEMKVDLAGGLVGIPLAISGPLDAPQIQVPPTAMAGAAAGAAVGTVLLPGIGTAIGASVGAAMGKAFGGGKKEPAR